MGKKKKKKKVTTAHPTESDTTDNVPPVPHSHSHPYKTKRHRKKKTKKGGEGPEPEVATGEAADADLPPPPLPPVTRQVSIFHLNNNDRKPSITSTNEATPSEDSFDGSQSVHPTVSVIIINEETSIPDIPITGKETEQDIIDKFNEYYRHHKQKRKKGVLRGDSISGTAVTHSQLWKLRGCRLVLMRRLLILCSLILWGFSLVFALFWFMTMYIWPRHFTLNEHVTEYYGKEIDDPSLSYGILGITVLHCGVVGAWGLISASCGQDKVLKRFMLTAPWFILISIVCGFVAVNFVGGLSQQKLSKSMLHHQGLYAHPGDTENASKIGWDTAQLFLRCCGIESPEEWVKVNFDTPEKVPKSCCRNWKGRHETNETLIKICVEDDRLGLVFPEGCKDKIFDFATLVGAAVTATCFSVTFIVILAVMFAHKFYVLKKKIRIGHYHYPLHEYLIDFFYLRPCVFLYRRRKRRMKVAAEPAANADPLADDAISLEEYELYAAMEDAVIKEEKKIEAQEEAEHREYMEEKKKGGGGRAPPTIRGDKEGRAQNNVSLLYRNPKSVGPTTNTKPVTARPTATPATTNTGRKQRKSVAIPEKVNK